MNRLVYPYLSLVVVVIGLVVQVIVVVVITTEGSIAKIVVGMEAIGECFDLEILWCL